MVNLGIISYGTYRGYDINCTETGNIIISDVCDNKNRGNLKSYGEPILQKAKKWIDERITKRLT